MDFAYIYLFLKGMLSLFHSSSSFLVIWNSSNIKNTVKDRFALNYLNTGLQSYRFSFNGMEKDNEIKGAGNSLDFGARIYDPRLGRWLSMDPQMVKYPNVSSYCGFGNTPTFLIDPSGGDIYRYYYVRRKDGTLIQIGKQREISGDVYKRRYRAYPQTSHLDAADWKQDVIYDETTDTWSVSKKSPDRKHPYTWLGYHLKMLDAFTDAMQEKANSRRGKQLDGMHFTSEFGKFLDGAKTDVTIGESDRKDKITRAISKNVSAFEALIASARSGKAPKFEKGQGQGEITKAVTKAIGEIIYRTGDGSNGEGSKPTHQDSCSCGYKGKLGTVKGDGVNHKVQPVKIW